MDQALTIGVRHQGRHVLITVAGEIDIATVAQLRDRLAPAAASGRPVIADLTGVTFLDAAGLGVLAGAAAKAAAGGGSLHVAAARHQVRRLFAITGLDRQIPLARTPAQALARLHAAPDIPPAGNRRTTASGSRHNQSMPPARR
jgi:anti-anti-sigma factor